MGKRRKNDGKYLNSEVYQQVGRLLDRGFAEVSSELAAYGPKVIHVGMSLTGRKLYRMRPCLRNSLTGGEVGELLLQDVDDYQRWRWKKYPDEFERDAKKAGVPLAPTKKRLTPGATGRKPSVSKSF